MSGIETQHRHFLCHNYNPARLQLVLVLNHVSRDKDMVMHLGLISVQHAVVI